MDMLDETERQGQNKYIGADGLANIIRKSDRMMIEVFWAC